MGKIVIPTKFNKTGKRVLTTPLQEKWVCAPANRRYREACPTIKSAWKQKLHEARHLYIETMSNSIASYVANSSTSDEEKYMIIKFLAKESLMEKGSIDINGPQRWANQLGSITGLSQAVEEASRIYKETLDRVFKEHDEALSRAREECDAMKRALWREISDHIHHQYHPEDYKPSG